MDRTVTFKQEETSGHEFQPGLDTKTDRLPDRQLQCDSDSDYLGNRILFHIDGYFVFFCIISLFPMSDYVCNPTTCHLSSSWQTFVTYFLSLQIIMLCCAVTRTYLYVANI
jgi:hypothetical protein